MEHNLYYRMQQSDRDALWLSAYLHLGNTLTYLFWKYCYLLIDVCILLQRWRTVVLRRYSDFVALQDILLLRYPYRAIPRLPPKKVIVTEG